MNMLNLNAGFQKTAAGPAIVLGNRPVTKAKRIPDVRLTD
jgi:hypothetical protein